MPRRDLGLIQARIESTPVSEQQYARHHSGSRSRETEVRRSQQETRRSRRSPKISSGSQQGETLEVLDPASLPQTPTQPKRRVDHRRGNGLGLVIGLFLAGAREAKDTSLKNLKDVRAYTQLTILGSVPLLENDLVVRRRKRLTWLAWSTACLVGIVIMTGSAFYYYATRV